MAGSTCGSISSPSQEGSCDRISNWPWFGTSPPLCETTPPAQRRQATYLGALRAATAVDVVLGRFQEKHVTCHGCRNQWRTYEEKETDVSIAIALLEDGVKSRFDTALLISADSDLCPAVKALKRLLPQKRVIAVFRRSAGQTTFVGLLMPASRWVTQSSGNRCSRPRSSTALGPFIAGQRVGGDG